MRKVLIYNNRTGLADKLEPYLAGEKLQMVIAQDSNALNDRLQDRDIAIMLLDVEMNARGWSEGMDIIVNARKCSEIPMIVVSGQAAETAKILALEAGADDYVTENCNPLEVLARIKCHIRRYNQLTGGVRMMENVYTLNGLVVDDSRHTVSVEGRSVRLTPIEYSILKLLMERKGTILSNTEIYETIWNMKAIGADNTIAVHVRHIREKIEENPKEPKYLKVVWGTGYKIG